MQLHVLQTVVALSKRRWNTGDPSVQLETHEEFNLCWLLHSNIKSLAPYCGFGLLINLLILTETRLTQKIPKSDVATLL